MAKKELMAGADPNLVAAHAVCEAAGQPAAAATLAEGAAAGIPWQDLLKGLITLALPVFQKWVMDWLAGNRQPLPDAPKMP